MKLFYRLIPVLLVLSCGSPTPDKQDFTRFVNPLIGTDGTGHTFPGPCMPFGMVQPGPDNRNLGWEYASGYQYRDPMILGFSQNRCSGTGIPELGDVLLLPFSGEEIPAAGVKYQKSSEKATVGRYAVTLADGTGVELAAGERVAFHRYTFPKGTKPRLLIDLQHGLRFRDQPLVLKSSLKFENDSTLSGYCYTDNWVKRQYYFTIRFQQRVKRREILPQQPEDRASRMLVAFDAPADRVIQLKVALSTVEVEGAKQNLAEIPHWNYTSVVENAQKVWNGYLGRVEIEADQWQQEIFYTSLYHLFIQPNNIADADGRYRGPNDSVMTAPGGVYYSTLSLWDGYRAAFPLLQLLAPEKVSPLIQSMLAHHNAQGYLPVWTVWGQETHCMIGNHALPVIAGAYLNGFQVEAGEALKAMVTSSTEDHPGSDWKRYTQYGYYPFDKVDHESVSRTLESGVDDYCLALMAEKMGRTDVAETFRQRAAFYRNLYDPQTRLFRGRTAKGRWRTPFDPFIATSPMNNPGDYTEANAWQYFWTPAQHDPAGLIQLLGGQAAFTAKLDSFFTLKAVKPDVLLGQEAMIGQYAHGNEPGHHAAYLYAYSNAPVRGRERIRDICRQFYRNTPDGLKGNDDCGQMSAWYVFSALGFYPVNPVSGELVAGMAQVKKATIHFPGRQDFVIRNTAEGIPTRISLKGKGELKPPFILRFEQVTGGGEMVFGE